MCFTEKEQKRLDEIARKIADILWDTYPEKKGRYTWELAHKSALELVVRFNHPSTATELMSPAVGWRKPKRGWMGARSESDLGD